MRRFLYALILGALFLAPLDRVEIGDLEPVEAVAVSVKGSAVYLRTDTGDEGQGGDGAAALADMKAKSPTLIYLDTARFLLVAPGAEAAARELAPYLRGNVKVAPYNGGDVADEANYADLHNRLPRLRRWLEQGF